MAQKVYYLLCFVTAIVAYVGVTALVQRGYGFAAFLLVLAFWGVFLLLAFFEGGTSRFRNVTSWRKQSWAFLCDPLLALGFCVTAWAWRSPQRQMQAEWIGAWWWLVLSATVGLGATYVFTLMDQPRYYDARHAAALVSPTKVWHDWPTYWVMFSSAVAVMAPLLWVWTWHTWFVLGCVTVWALAGVRDMVRPPDVHMQHIAWDASRFAPVH